jgi:hypothetical protein
VRVRLLRRRMSEERPLSEVWVRVAQAEGEVVTGSLCAFIPTKEAEHGA